MRLEKERREAAIRTGEGRGALSRVFLFLALLAALPSLTSCGAAPASTAIACTSNTSTSSSTTSTSTCTDPTTNISVTISPATASVNVVTTQQFQDFISGGTNNVTIWQVNSITGGNDTIGRIDSNGLYHAPTAVPSPAAVTVAAISFEDQKLSATATVTVTPAPVVTITSPAAPVTVTSGSANTVTFTATETGGTTDAVLWYVGPVGGLGVLGGNATFGTISAAGVYSPPLAPPIGQTVTVTAAAQDAPTSTAAENVTISGYSASSLQGSFAFSLAGTSASGRYFRAGSFAADGSGGLNSVLEDVNTTAGVTSMVTTGSYTMSADGRGTLQFNDGLTPASFHFVLVNGTQMQIIGFDSSGTAAGQANAQDISTFVNTPLSALQGTYVFDFSGAHGANGLSEIGEFGADGAGNITRGAVDINDGGTLTALQIAGTKTVCSPAPATLSTYSVASSGRGTLTLATLTSACAAGPTLSLDFYVATRGGAKFVGTDTALQVAGFSTGQSPNAAFNVASLNGNFAFLLAGTGLGGTITTAGSFAADGAGHIATGEVDENVAPGAPSLDLPILASPPGSYTLASNGRGTATFATSASRIYTFVFYVGQTGSSTTAVLQETDAGIASHGNFARQQGGGFTLASVQGNYAIETSGVSGAALQVSAGQIGVNGSGTISSGALDTNTGGTTLTTGQAVTGSYTAPDAAGRSLLTLNSGTANYAAYVVSPTLVYVLGIPSGQPQAGALLRQF